MLIKKDVIVSIRPEWCEKIVSGEKVLELRKSAPDIWLPFVSFIYCTSVKSMSIQRYVDVHRKTGGSVDAWSGNVIGWFVCDTIVTDKTCGHDALVNGAACLDEKDAVEYANGKPIIGWHIQSLHLFDKPKPISDFGVQKPPRSWFYCPRNLIAMEEKQK